MAASRKVGLPALEQRLQQQQKGVEDLGAALEEPRDQQENIRS